MEQVIRAYGKFLLNSMVVLLLSGFLLFGIVDDEGNHGIFQIAGAQVMAAKIEKEKPEEFRIYQAEAVKKPPRISLLKSEPLCVGSHKIAEYIRAVDWSGREIPIRLCGITDAEGAEVDSCNPETSEVCFTEPGIYVVEVSATDMENRRSVYRMKLPVSAQEA